MDKYSKEIIRTLVVASGLALGAIALGCCLLYRRKPKAQPDVIEKRENNNMLADAKANTKNIMLRDFAKQR